MSGREPRAAHAADLVAEHEVALADLYRACAWRLPEHWTLWNDIRADELVHAGWARSLADVPAAAEALDVSAVTKSLADVRDALARVRDGRVSATEALAASLMFKKAMLAGGFLDRETGDPIARATLRAMRSSTVGHLERVRAAYESAARVAS